MTFTVSVFCSGQGGVGTLHKLFGKKYQTVMIQYTYKPLDMHGLWNESEAAKCWLQRPGKVLGVTSKSQDLQLFLVWQSSPWCTTSGVISRSVVVPTLSPSGPRPMSRFHIKNWLFSFLNFNYLPTTGMCMSCVDYYVTLLVYLNFLCESKFSLSNNIQAHHQTSW